MKYIKTEVHYLMVKRICKLILILLVSVLLLLLLFYSYLKVRKPKLDYKSAGTQEISMTELKANTEKIIPDSKFRYPDCVIIQRGDKANPYRWDIENLASIGVKIPEIDFDNNSLFISLGAPVKGIYYSRIVVFPYRDDLMQLFNKNRGSDISLEIDTDAHSEEYDRAEDKIYFYILPKPNEDSYYTILDNGFHINKADWSLWKKVKDFINWYFFHSWYSQV